MSHFNLNWIPAILLFFPACSSDEVDWGIPCLVDGTRRSMESSEVATAGMSADMLVSRADEFVFDAEFTPLPSGDTEMDTLTWSMSIDGEVFEQESQAQDGESPPVCLNGVVLYVPIWVAVDSEQGIHAEGAGYLLATGDTSDEWWMDAQLPVDLPTNMDASGSGCPAGDTSTHMLTVTSWPENPWTALRGNIERREASCVAATYQWRRGE